MNLEQHIQELKTEILRLKKERNAVILAHSYQSPYIQDAADFVGSSLQLARKAQNIDCETIVFAGVDFMANTAKVLNPNKTVLIPHDQAICPLARMLTVEDLKEAKKKFPRAPILLYTNTTVECQALADTIYTAGNAIEIVDGMAKESGSDVIIFGPDVNMAYFVGKKLNCKGLVKTGEGVKNIKGLKQGKRLLYVPSHGYCSPHIRILPEAMEATKEKFPNAKILVHSECYPAVQELADFVGSTGDMVKYVKMSKAKEFLIGTEKDFCYKLQTDVPNKKYHPIGKLNGDDIVCPHMKLHSLERIKDSLSFNMYEVNVPKDVAERARQAIEKMLRR
jgi:quinolinate synthase